MDKQDLPDWPDEYPEPIKYKKDTVNLFLIFVSIALVSFIIICVMSIGFVSIVSETPVDINISIHPQATSTLSANVYPVITPIKTGLSPPTSKAPTTPIPTPKAYVTVNVNEFETYTVYWQRELWENAVFFKFLLEDFEDADEHSLSLPYLTPSGFFLEGKSSGRIRFCSLINGNCIHFRDNEDGLKFSFPKETASKAFGFNYMSSEKWQLTFNDSAINLPRGRGGFVGIVLHKGFAREFIISSPESAQGGMFVDNISYVPIEVP